MVAYSFNRRFVAAVRLGITGECPMDEFRSPRIAVHPKRQTIRADRKRHARPGEELQLYCGMRTKGCFLIGRARCTSVGIIRLQLGLGLVSVEDYPAIRDENELDVFAQADGFAHWSDMRDFWDETHGKLDFEGVIIKWEPIQPGTPAEVPF